MRSASGSDNGAWWQTASLQETSTLRNVMLELNDSFNPYTLHRLPDELSTDTRVTLWSQCSDAGSISFATTLGAP